MNRYQKHRERNLDQSKRWRSENKDKVTGWAKRYRVSLRREIVEAYGGKCTCCGEHRWKFLTLDHPDGKGQEDRAKYRMQTGQLYAWVKSEGFPKGYYRLLCMNCNWVRRYDVCPHEEERRPDYKPEPIWRPMEKLKTGPRQRFVPTLVQREKATPLKEKDPNHEPIIGKRVE